jgi:hypothetical protein
VVGDRHPFEEGEPGGFRHGVGRREDVIEQRRGRDGAHDVAFTSRLHSRKQGARGVHVRHDMHVPALPPCLVGCFGPTRERDAGIGAVDIDPPICRDGAAHQFRNVRLHRDVRGHGRATDLRGDPLRRLAVDVGHHDLAGAVGLKPPAERAADASATARHDYDATKDFHR